MALPWWASAPRSDADADAAGVVRTERVMERIPSAVPGGASRYVFVGYTTVVPPGAAAAREARRMAVVVAMAAAAAEGTGGMGLSVKVTLRRRCHESGGDGCGGERSPWGQTGIGPAKCTLMHGVASPTHMDVSKVAASVASWWRGRAC